MKKELFFYFILMMALKKFKAFHVCSEHDLIRELREDIEDNG